MPERIYPVWMTPMIARLDNLRKSPVVFRHLTGLTVEVFDELAAEVVPAAEAAHRQTLDRPDRKRAVGGGDDFDLSTADQILLTVVWLRQYPTNETLGFLFGVSDSTASRVRTRCLPVLEKAGRDAMRMPDPGAARRKKLPGLLKDTPGLAVVIDSFEQRTQRPRRRQRAYYSGKKKAHTLKSQVAVDEESGRIVDVSDSVPGRWADIKLLEKSRLLKRLPTGVGGIGDLGYVGIGALHPSGAGGAYRNQPSWDRAGSQGFRLSAPGRGQTRSGLGKVRNAVERCHNFFAQFGRVRRRRDRHARNYLGWCQMAACVILIRSGFVR